MLAAMVIVAPSVAFDQEPAITVPSLYLYMDKDKLNELYTRDIFSNDRLDGVIRLSPKGENLELRGLRFRGNTTRYSPKKSFNIRFEDDQDFLFGSSRMNLNAMFTDPSMMRERLAWTMFQQLKQPASRTQYFNLFINNIYEGLYTHIERVDGDLLENAGLDPDGTLVRDQLRRSDDSIDRNSIFGFDLSQISDPEAFLDDNFNSRGDPNWSAVIDFVEWVNRTPAGSEFARGFTQRVDIANFIDWLAVHYLIGDIDSFGDDYWIYRSQNDPKAKWKFIPWDKDLTFGAFERPVEDPLERQLHHFFAYEYPITDGGWDNELVSKFLATPQLKAQLDQRLKQLMQEVFPPEYVRKQIETIAAAIADDVNTLPGEGRFRLHPQNHHGELGRFQFHTENLLDFIELRYQFLERQLNPIEGLPYVATVDLRNYKQGDTVFFTDATGWTIAKLELANIVNPGLFSVIVSPNSGIFGIDRMWTTFTNSTLTGTLSFYYRNSIDPEFGKENWYYEPVATGNQWNLSVAEIKGVARPLRSRVNAYSNKVSTDLTLSGLQQFVITAPKTSN
jgi:spore coat protein H